jgi:hypothetical protein
LAETEMETQHDARANYAEVEERDGDLERFEKCLTAICDRDYFETAGGAEARSVVPLLCGAGSG